jgi:hypothetical protein
VTKDVKRALMIAKEDREANRARFLKGSKAPLRLYHGTNAPEDFSAFSVGKPHYDEDMGQRQGSGPDPTTYLGSHFAEEPEVASRFAHGLYGERRYRDNHGRVYPVHLAIKKPHVTTEKEMYDWMIRQDLRTASVEHLLGNDEALINKYSKYPAYRQLINQEALKHEHREDEPTYETAQEMARKYRDHLMSKGHDGIKYKNEVEGGTSWVAFRPEQIKSAVGNRGTFDPNDPDITKAQGGSVKRALMIARDQRDLLRRVANIYPGPGGGMDPGPNGGGYAGPGGGKYIGPSNYADGGKIPPFKLHSGAAKLIAAKGQPKATPQQYAAMPGIKPDELKHSNFAGLPSKAMPREEVIKHLEGNKIPIKETVLGGGDQKELLKDLMIDERDRYEQRFEDRVGRPPRSDSELLAEMPSLAFADELAERGGTKYDDYKLPGGKNYREVLLHLPAKEQQAYAIRYKDGPQMGKAFGSEEEAQAALQEMFPGRHDLEVVPEQATSDNVRTGRALTKENFKSSHWDEPNVLAHIRMSDRKGPNGEKVLHVEELQSDWGQQGREQGFALPPLTKNDVEYEKIPWEQYKAEEPLAGYTRDWRRENGYPEDAPVVRYRLRGGLDSSGKPIGWNSHGNPNMSHDDIFELARTDNSPHTAIGERNAQSQRGAPRGPYVDNTQKWTDLALKRVLHEAAHGGYDKVVFTPGDEQNKRYDLSSQVKNIQYFPDAKYLSATTHDNRGIEQENVSPDDLAKHIGKEAADRILKQPRQRFEGRGKLANEEYHELEGDNLKIGGQGMRGYYDNIMPKRLQALAQQHDPKAKVQLGSFPLKPKLTTQEEGWQRATGEPYVPENAPAPLHSLDITPQMRDSIKANGFNQFKRGGEVDDPIANWHWRPLEDVRNELQLDEIPSHVHKFGEFMDETARRATTHGLTPRDLIKAYAITRASIGRRALPAETLREAFTELPLDVTGRVRPEGAMGHWLHTKMGQRYLDEAEAGRVDEEAIEHARNAMRRFGKDQTEPMALRWAALNLPGKESRVSELIARAHRGQSAPEEWRGEMRMPGIAESKAGFLASMLGRGDQPTLDARQLILHTGRPTKEAAPILSRKGASEAAVNRLAGRQSELKLKHDPEMSPFYQHLAHHTIWDKAAGEETTHEDLMRALRGAKRGGRQTEKPLSLIASHPVVQGMAAALPAEAELKALLRKAGIVRPYEQPNKENIEKALKIARTYAMPLGAGASTSELDPSAYYNVAQPVAARDVTTKTLATKGYSLKPENPMSWSDFASIGKGGHVLNLSGDRTRFGTLHEINGKKLNWPVKVFAGPDYIREPVKGRAWASGSGVVSGLNSLVRELSKKGPVFGMYSPYGGTGGDFAHHMFDAVMAQVNPDDLTKGAKNKFDVAMRNGHFIMGGTDKIAKIRDRVKQKMGDWPGIDNPKKASEFARTKLTGDERKAILEYLDKKMWTDEGFPHVGITRVAVTDPKLLGVPQNVIGGNVALLKPSEKLPSSQHPSFPAGMAGEYVGTVPFSPRHYALPVSTAHFAKTPSAGKGIHVDPYSLDPMARAGYRTLFERNYVPEPVSQQMVEGAEEGIKKMPLYGLKTGGNVIARALKIARKTNGR